MKRRRRIRRKAVKTPINMNAFMELRDGILQLKNEFRVVADTLPDGLSRDFERDAFKLLKLLDKVVTGTAKYIQRNPNL